MIAHTPIWRAATVAAYLGCATPACAEPANSFKDMFAQFGGCLGRISLKAGTDVTVQFMLNRRGGIIGKPRITHAQWAGDEADRRAAATLIAEGFDRCLPIEITDAFGGAIAGRMFTYRFHAPTARQDKV